jgi:DNA-binding transcriptional LysR family regulator
MELRHLRYFVAVAEALSFRKAAGRLSVSEPAVSQQVADLEGELGLKLFNRDSRRVELTEVGRVFLRGARRTLANAKEAVAQAEEAAAGERGRLSIGSIGPLVHAFLPDALARFREHFPLVEVTVLNMDDRTQVEALANGTIMLGIGWAGPNLAESESLTATPLLRHPTVGVSFHVLDGSKGEFEMFLMRTNSSEPAATVDNFVKIIAESVLRLRTPVEMISTDLGQLTDERARAHRRSRKER